MARSQPVYRLAGWGVLIALSMQGHPVVADIFHLKSGNTIEGEVLNDLGDAYRVRVVIGVIDIRKEDIDRREPGKTPWQRYAEVRAKHPDTANGHYRLAQWCGKHGLVARQTKHLRRAIELDPEHEPAHLALGHIRLNGRWTDPDKTPHVDRPDKQAIKERQARQKEETLLQAIIADWFLKVRAIYGSRLDCKTCRPDSNRFKEGRARILAIRDSLALPALTGVLSGGNVATRRVLVESLAQFSGDEATMNLVVMALLDPSRDVRRLAAIELVPRKDDRIIERLRDALKSDEEPILRHAAVALGILNARPAIEDLIRVLSTRARQRVRVTRPIFLRHVINTFGGGTRVEVGSRRIRYRPSSIGVLDQGAMVGTVDGSQVRVVDVYRTDVQEALIAITGQNLGFDRDKWLRWWRQQDD
ncbi:MAG: HEAT repeat domain-containing protein [Phycisphaerae bacterium]